MALSIVLLVCAGLFLRNLRQATTIDKGFDSGHQLIASVDPGLEGYDRARTEEFYRRLTERLKSNPAVVHATTASRVQLGLANSDAGTKIPGYTPAPNENMSIPYNVVTPDYFETMGITLTRGRGFATRDDSSAQGAIVVNQHFADHFFPGADPMGRTVHMLERDHVIIGVVPTGKYSRLGEDPTSYVYLAQAQHFDIGRWIQVRTAGDPAAFIPTLRAEVAAIDPDLPLSDVRTMTTHLGIALLPARVAGSVLGVFGVLGLGLAAIGIYGVMAYVVAQRTREIGIRMAIGAGRGDVMLLVLRQGLGLVVGGAAIGLVLALGAARLAKSAMYGSAGFDGVTFATVPLVLLGVASLAIWFPARRASSLDPVVALRRD